MPAISWVESHPAGIAIRRDIEAYFTKHNGNMDNMPKASFWYSQYEHLLEEVANVKKNYKDNLRSFIKRKKDDLIKRKYILFLYLVTLVTVSPSSFRRLAR